ncbi:MAG TPA: AAA family ATPase [Candidatus Saccharimonadales bacterium]|nr:AAA family ATPase [Candidatus Saccharimonadales bacterium]
MVYNKDVKIVAFVGMAGAGKSTAVDYVTNKGYPKVYGGGIFYEAMRDAGIEPTQQNENDFRTRVHKNEGQDQIVKEFIGQIHALIDAGQHRIVTDSNYSWDEYKAMKHEFPGELNVVAVVAPKHIRHHRLLSRLERPLTETESSDRDWREIEDLQSGGVIAIADHYIINDGDLDNLYKQINDTLNDIEFYKN